LEDWRRGPKEIAGEEKQNLESLAPWSAREVEDFLRYDRSVSSRFFFLILFVNLNFIFWCPNLELHSYVDDFACTRGHMCRPSWISPKQHIWTFLIFPENPLQVSKMWSSWCPYYHNSVAYLKRKGPFLQPKGESMGRDDALFIPLC